MLEREEQRNRNQRRGYSGYPHGVSSHRRLSHGQCHHFLNFTGPRVEKTLGSLLGEIEGICWPRGAYDTMQTIMSRGGDLEQTVLR